MRTSASAVEYVAAVVGPPPLPAPPPGCWAVAGSRREGCVKMTFIKWLDKCSLLYMTSFNHIPCIVE